MKTINTIGIQDVGPYYWIGKCHNGIEYFAGQTFTTKQDGSLKSIKIHPEFIVGSTDMKLSLYELNNDNKEWQSIKEESFAFVDKKLEGQWIQFTFKHTQLQNSKSYGFKVSCTNGGMIAISENPWNILDPYKGGEEWIGSSIKPEGVFQKDFDLAFEAIVE